MPSTIGWLSSMKRLTSVMVARRSALCESRSRLANQRTRTRLDQTGSRSVRPRAKDFNHLHTGPQGPLFDPLISPVLGQDPDLTQGCYSLLFAVSQSKAGRGSTPLSPIVENYAQTALAASSRRSSLSSESFSLNCVSATRASGMSSHPSRSPPTNAKAVAAAIFMGNMVGKLKSLRSTGSLFAIKYRHSPRTVWNLSSDWATAA